MKARLKPNGAAAFNVHYGTKLYVSTIFTLQTVLATIDLYPSGEVGRGRRDYSRYPAAWPRPRNTGSPHGGTNSSADFGFRFPLSLRATKQRKSVERRNS